MSISGSGSSPKPLERVMIFIDGGYIRKLFHELFNNDKIDFTKVSQDLLHGYNNWQPNPHRANLIRIYYFDGIADPKDDPETHFEQREYFETLEKSNQNLDINLGEAVKTRKGNFRQKGVDILLTIDALSMAYENLYDSGLFLLGDRDFIPLIQAVKNTGKKTFGFYYNEKVAKELSTTFDFRIAFDKEIMKKWLKEE